MAQNALLWDFIMKLQDAGGTWRQKWNPDDGNIPRKTQVMKDFGLGQHKIDAMLNFIKTNNSDQIDQVLHQEGKQPNHALYVK